MYNLSMNWVLQNWFKLGLLVLLAGSSVAYFVLTPRPEVPEHLEEAIESVSPTPVSTPIPTPVITPTPVSTPIPTPAPTFDSQDSELQIAQCEAESRNKVAEFIDIAYEQVEQILGVQVSNAVQYIQNLQAAKLDSCYGWIPELSPAQNNQINLACKDGYDQDIEETRIIKEDWEDKVEEGKDEADRLGEQAYYTFYAECLNR